MCRKEKRSPQKLSPFLKRVENLLSAPGPPKPKGIRILLQMSISSKERDYYRCVCQVKSMNATDEYFKGSECYIMHFKGN